MHCEHCGREISAGRCANLLCPGMTRWRPRVTAEANVVELRPFVERGQTSKGFIGTLYTREVRIIDGCECRGVSVSTVASGESKEEVLRQLSALAKQRADHYSCRGYKVVMPKLLAA